MEFEGAPLHVLVMRKRGPADEKLLDAPRQSLMAAARASERDLANLSKAIGRNHAYLGQYVWRGVPRRLEEEDRAKLAAILEIDEKRLKPATKPQGEHNPVDNTLRKVAPKNEIDVTLKPGDTPELRSAGNAVQVLTEQEDLPVYGYVAGAGEDEVFFIDQGHEMTRTVRPTILKNAPDAYAVDVYGDSMSPRFEPGNRLWVHPNRPTKPGDDIVIQLDRERAIVKRLVRKTEKFVIVLQFNPRREIKIPRGEIKQIDLVVGMLTVAT